MSLGLRDWAHVWLVREDGAVWSCEGGVKQNRSVKWPPARIIAMPGVRLLRGLQGNQKLKVKLRVWMGQSGGTKPKGRWVSIVAKAFERKDERALAAWRVTATKGIRYKAVFVRTSDTGSSLLGERPIAPEEGR